MSGDCAALLSFASTRFDTHCVLILETHASVGILVACQIFVSHVAFSYHLMLQPDAASQRYRAVPTSQYHVHVASLWIAPLCKYKQYLVRDNPLFNISFNICEQHSLTKQSRLYVSASSISQHHGCLQLPHSTWDWQSSYKLYFCSPNNMKRIFHLQPNSCAQLEMCDSTPLHAAHGGGKSHLRASCNHNCGPTRTRQRCWGCWRHGTWSISLLAHVLHGKSTVIRRLDATGTLKGFPTR